MGNIYATLILGNVKTEVKLVKTTTEKEQIKFRLLHDKCSHPIAAPRTCGNDACEKFGKPLMSSEIIRGWEASKGVFAKVTDDEYKAVHQARQPVIVLSKFVGFGDGPGTLPMKDSYYLIDENRLTPSYALIAEAMATLEVDAIGRCNLWDREWPFAVVTNGEALMLRRMHTADELVEVGKQTSWLGKQYLDDQYGTLLEWTARVVQERTGKFSMDDLISEPDRQMGELVHAKAAGKKAPKVVKETPLGTTTDLMTALKASVNKPPRKKKAVKVA